MDLTFDVTLLGGLVLVVGAAIIGIGCSLFAQDPTPYEWLMPGIAAFIGGFGASEFMGLDATGPVWEGVALMPAVVGGLVLGVLVEAIARAVKGGTTAHGARPI